MRLTFYLQYFDYNDEKFDVDNNYYQSSDDYIKQLEDNYNQTKDVIFETMMNGTYNDTKSYKMTDYIPLKQEKKASYTKCEGVLLDTNGKEEDIDTLLSHFANGTMNILEMKLDANTYEEEFQLNWAMFFDASEKIEKCDAPIRWKFSHKPIKDIYFSLINYNNEIVYGKMEGCKIDEVKDIYDNVLIVEKIVFLKNLE